MLLQLATLLQSMAVCINTGTFQVLPVPPAPIWRVLSLLLPTLLLLLLLLLLLGNLTAGPALCQPEVCLRVAQPAWLGEAASPQ
jgi:hypothetical protein